MSGGEASVQGVRGYLEGLATGLAYACGLAAVSVFIAASFRPARLYVPYWSYIPWLRTDTFGFGCFVVATAAFACSEFLRLSRGVRRQSTTALPDVGPLVLLVTAASRALGVAASVLVLYLSVNAVTHPETLSLQATHLLSWPTEGALRVIALVVAGLAVGIARIERIVMNER